MLASILHGAVFLFCAASAPAIRANLHFWITRRWHLALIACQGVGLFVYLACVVRGFNRMTTLISATRAEWRADLEQL